MDLFLPIIHDGEDKSSPFKNCIRKNYKHLRKWASRTVTNAFRIYDRHMHHYPLAIDFYNQRFCVHYFSPNREEDIPEALVNEVESTLIDLFQTDASTIYWKNRIRRKKFEQYEKIEEKKDFFPVLEYGITFKVNLVDYLDTGLFLDHRETRRFISTLAKDKRVLNLFAYTCAFSLHAAMAGAHSTKSVDMSNTYTDWGRDNFILNGLDTSAHPIIREDCLKFLEKEVRTFNRYDLIIIDPPTLSRSKKMDQLFDIQKDYIFLIKKALQLLDDKGTIFFSTNSRRFVFDLSLFNECNTVDVSSKTLPLDFHDPYIHRCWKITKKIC